MMRREAVLQEIVTLMDGCAWDERTLEQIAALMQDAGYRIRDRHDRDVDRTADLPKKLQVWVVTVDHKHGQDQWTYSSESKAYDGLAAYAEEWWQETGETEKPEDRDALIAAYFEVMEGREWYSVAPTTVDA